VTGTTTITSLGTGPNLIRYVRFSGSLTLTHNATTLILPGGTNIQTQAGDWMIISSDSSSNVRVLNYQPVLEAPYTEGSWTPAMTFGGSGTGVTYGLQTGTYARYGHMVHITGRVTLTNNGSGTGTALVTGLPFSSNSSTNVISYIGVSFSQNLSGITGNLQMFVTQNATTLGLLQGSATGTASISDTNITNTADFSFSGWYLAA
jgi:hypothetical protein